MRAGIEPETALQSSREKAYQSPLCDKVMRPCVMILPDRLSTDPKSPFHNAELLEQGVGIRFNGVDRDNVEEYCVSEGWVRLAVGKTVDRHGNAMTVKYKGKVEPYLRQKN